MSEAYGMPPPPGILPSVTVTLTGQRWNGYPIWKCAAALQLGGFTGAHVIYSLSRAPVRLLNVIGFYQPADTVRPHVYQIRSMNFPSNNAPLIYMATNGDLIFNGGGSTIKSYAIEAFFVWLSRS